MEEPMAMGWPKATLVLDSELHEQPAGEIWECLMSILFAFRLQWRQRKQFKKRKNTDFPVTAGSRTAKDLLRFGLVPRPASSSSAGLSMLKK
jgi:hypothetical protein